MAAQDEESTRTPRQYPLLNAALEHGPLLATVVAALLFAIRCVIVTEGEPYPTRRLPLATRGSD
jgi:hypothetical protein